jgi:hypothetical protein
MLISAVRCVVCCLLCTVSHSSFSWLQDLTSGAGAALVARCDNVQSLVALLAPLVLEKKSLARVDIQNIGLVVTTEQRTLQATARLDKGLFSEWAGASGEHFVVALGTLVECLQVFGRHAIGTTVRMAWRGYGEDLMVVVHEV